MKKIELEKNFFCYIGQYGKIEYKWNFKLEKEDGPNYLPKGYSKKVLELVYIEVSALGVGYGDKLMQLFLESEEANQSELIFCEPNPGMGLFAIDNKSMSNENYRNLIKKQKDSLQRFYSKYGFRQNPESLRMWLVKKGELRDNELP